MSAHESPQTRRNDGSASPLPLLLSLAGTSLGVYLFGLRPWLQRWGATEAEVRRPLPGDELVTGANHWSTRAITVNASAAEVWPWLAQMGQGRGGLYSYDGLENLAGLDIQGQIANSNGFAETTGQLGDLNDRIHAHAPPVPFV